MLFTIPIVTITPHVVCFSRKEKGAWCAQAKIWNSYMTVQMEKVCSVEHSKLLVNGPRIGACQILITGQLQRSSRTEGSHLWSLSMYWEERLFYPYAYAFRKFSSTDTPKNQSPFLGKKCAFMRFGLTPLTQRKN